MNKFEGLVPAVHVDTGFVFGGRQGYLTVSAGMRLSCLPTSLTTIVNVDSLHAVLLVDVSHSRPAQGVTFMCSSPTCQWACAPDSLSALQVNVLSAISAADMSDVGMAHHLQPLQPIQPQHLPPMDPPLCACGDLATFAMTGSCRPTHCMAHREPGMMEVKKCVCGKARPSYALPGAAEATHCARYHYN